MKLRSLAVNQFRKFTSPVKLEGIEDGLNIVVGPNEMGKSTLLDALRAVLFEKHDSKAKSVREMRNERNQAAPVVELTFELEDGIHSVSKRFLKKSYASLRCPDGTTLNGADAESRLRDILNFSEPGKAAANPEALGMWNILWVKQGQSFGTPNLPESARADLHGALESEVGTVLGGRRGRELPRMVEKQLRELVTQTGRKRGKYKTASEQTDTLKEELEKLNAKKRDLSDTLKNLEDAQEKQKRFSDPGRNEEDRKKLERARIRLSELSEIENRVEKAESELKVRELRLERAEGERKQRHDLKSDVAKGKSALDNLREKLEETRAQEKQAWKNLEKLRAEEREAEMASKKADEIALTKSRLLTIVELNTRVRDLDSRLEKALNAEKRELEARNRASAIAVTENMIGRIAAAEKEVQKAASRLDATSTLITFEMENPSGIEVDGLPLRSGKDSLQAISPTTIAIPERGNITVEPAVKNHDELLGQHREAESRLRDVLNEACVSTVKEAEDLYSDRQRHLQDAEFARREAELHAPSTDDYEAGTRALADYTEKQRQILKNEMDSLSLRELPEHLKAETDLQNAADNSEAARHALDKARAALDGPEDILKSLGKELASTEARCEEGEKGLNGLLRKLEKAEEERTEEELEEETAAAQGAVEKQEATVAELHAKRSADDTLEQVEARVNRLEKAAEDRRSKYQRRELDIRGMQSRVEVLEGIGLDEDMERKKRELELWEQERRRYEREEQVLSILLETLRDAEREAKELYLSPITNRIRPYLQLLFPGSDITIDENLRITGVIREAGYEESFPLLSMGTQEQIAVLVRLAFAEMLVEQGHPATVVLDDALVFSDDTRMNRMFDILNVASRKVQILIFTCREQLFEDIGGHPLSLTPGDPEELMSA